jgi:hypothetical protein
MNPRDIETARCARCAVYTPIEDLRRATSGLLYCDVCGVPPASARAPSWTPSWEDDLSWVRRSNGFVLDRPTRIVAGLMIVITLVFPLAACLSQ